MRPTSIIGASKNELLQPSREVQTQSKGVSYYRIEQRERPGFEVGRRLSEISEEQVLRFEELHLTKANRALPKRRVAHGTALLQNG
jgi:hypothetical protein